MKTENLTHGSSKAVREIFKYTVFAKNGKGVLCGK